MRILTKLSTLILIRAQKPIRKGDPSLNEEFLTKNRGVHMIFMTTFAKSSSFLKIKKINNY